MRVCLYSNCLRAGGCPYTPPRHAFLAMVVAFWMVALKAFEVRVRRYLGVSCSADGQGGTAKVAQSPSGSELDKRSR